MKLQEIRKKRGFSQGELAKLSEVSVRTLQQYESGYRNINTAKLETLCMLAEALKCRVADIIDDEELLKLYKKVR